MVERTTRRRYLVTAVGAGITGMAGCTSGGTDETTPGTATSTGSPTGLGSVDGAWPMYRADAANTGTVADTTGPTESVTERWRYDLDQLVWSSPAVADGTVYIGCGDGYLYALNAASGSLAWRFETDEGVDSAPAVVDDTVYVGSDDGSLYAIGAETGSEQWAFDAGERVEMAPTVADGTVYVGTGNISEESGTMFAVDAATGEKRWQFDIDVDLANSATPAVVDGTVYFGTGIQGRGDHKLYALDAATGETAWTFQSDHAFSYPVVVDGTVYAAIDDPYFSLKSLDASTGERTERYTVEMDNDSNLVVADGVIYATYREKLFAVPEGENSPKWEFEADGKLWAGLVLVDGTLYFGSNDGNTYAVDAETGEQQWAYETADTNRGCPAVVDGTVFVPGHDGAVYALTEQ